MQPEESSAGGMLAVSSEDTSDESTASDSSAPDETSRDDFPFETLFMDLKYNNRSVTLEGRQIAEPEITEEERLMAENLYFHYDRSPPHLKMRVKSSILFEFCPARKPEQG